MICLGPGWAHDRSRVFPTTRCDPKASPLWCKAAFRASGRSGYIVKFGTNAPCSHEHRAFRRETDIIPLDGKGNMSSMLSSRRPEMQALLRECKPKQQRRGVTSTASVAFGYRLFTIYRRTSRSEQCSAGSHVSVKSARQNVSFSSCGNHRDSTINESRCPMAEDLGMHAAHRN